MSASSPLTLQAWFQGKWWDAAQVQQGSNSGSLGLSGPVQIAYDTAYALEHFNRSDVAAICSNIPVGIDVLRSASWPAFLVDCLPQGYGRGELLRQLNLPENTAQSGDWTLLAHGAGNLVGHLRIAQAHEWLIQRSQHRHNDGFTRADVSLRGERFAEHLARNGLFVAGSSGVQGEWPKILLSEDRHGMLHLDHQLPDEDSRRHFIVKFARGTKKRLNDILRLEEVWMALASHLGLRVHALPELLGRALFIERFDRVVRQESKESAKRGSQQNAGMLRHAQESLYSLCQRQAKDERLTHNMAVQALSRVASDPIEEVCEYLRRDVANVVLGNKDNHGRNTALQRREDGWTGLTPVFDFAPMYLHPDGIARRMRWELARPSHGGRADEFGPLMDNGTPDWPMIAELCTEILCSETFGKNHAPPTARVHQRLCSALNAMALAVADLPEAMHLLGVERPVIEHLRPGIEHHSESLARCWP